MSGPASISTPPSLRSTLRQHRTRIRADEGPNPGRWIYVVNAVGLGVTPATTPDDFVLLYDVDTTLLNPFFKNGCTNVTGSQAVSFRIHPETRVVIRGAVDVHSHALPVVVFTLPVGFRPAIAHPLVFPSTDGASLYTGRVDASGDVSLLAQIT